MWFHTDSSSALIGPSGGATVSPCFFGATQAKWARQVLILCWLKGSSLIDVANVVRFPNLYFGTVGEPDICRHAWQVLCGAGCNQNIDCLCHILAKWDFIYVMFSVILHVDEIPYNSSTPQIFVICESSKLNVGFCKDDFSIPFSVCDYLCTCNTTTATTIKTKETKTITSSIACVYFCYFHWIGLSENMKKWQNTAKPHYINEMDDWLPPRKLSPLYFTSPFSVACVHNRRIGWQHWIYGQ